MKVFDYECKECKKIFEKYIRGSEVEKIECPSCGSANTVKRLSAPKGFQFNGKGFEHNKK